MADDVLVNSTKFLRIVQSDYLSVQIDDSMNLILILKKALNMFEYRRIRGAAF